MQEGILNCPKCTRELTLIPDGKFKGLLLCVACNKKFETFAFPSGAEVLQAGPTTIIVKEDGYSGRTQGGIAVPRGGALNFQLKRYQYSGVILSVGREVQKYYEDSNAIGGCSYRVGDRILYALYARIEEFRHDGQVYVAVKGLPEIKCYREKLEGGESRLIEQDIPNVLGKLTFEAVNLDRGYGINEAAQKPLTESNDVGPRDVPPDADNRNDAVVERQRAGLQQPQSGVV